MLAGRSVEGGFELFGRSDQQMELGRSCGAREGDVIAIFVGCGGGIVNLDCAGDAPCGGLQFFHRFAAHLVQHRDRGERRAFGVQRNFAPIRKACCPGVRTVRAGFERRCRGSAPVSKARAIRLIHASLVACRGTIRRAAARLRGLDT